MKKKSGFVMVETIVCVAFLATSLIIIFRAFNNLITNEKKRLYFDDPVYLYRTYYLLDYLEEHNIIEFIESNLKISEKDPMDYGKPPKIRENGVVVGTNLSNVLTEFSCNDVAYLGDDADLCNIYFGRKKRFNVSHIYLTYADVTGIADCVDVTTNTMINSGYCNVPQTLLNLSPQAIKYIRTLGGYDTSGYRLIVEYKVPYHLDDDLLYDDYGNPVKNVTKETTRYYYASLLIPVGGVNDAK